MKYTPSQKKILRTQFYEAGRDIHKGYTRGKSFGDIIKKQMDIEKKAINDQNIEITDELLFSGICWGLIKRLKDTANFPRFLEESDGEGDISARLLETL